MEELAVHAPVNTSTDFLQFNLLAINLVCILITVPLS